MFCTQFSELQTPGVGRPKSQTSDNWDLLGHHSIKTTELYMHVTPHKRPVSPLTNLGL